MSDDLLDLSKSMLKMQKLADEMEPEIARLELIIEAYRNLRTLIHPSTNAPIVSRPMADTLHNTATLFQDGNPLVGSRPRSKPKAIARRPLPGRRTLDYLMRVLRDSAGYIDLKTAVAKMREYGWVTDSETEKSMMNNVRPLFRQYGTLIESRAGKHALTAKGRETIDATMADVIATGQFLVETESAAHDLREIEYHRERGAIQQ